MQININLMRYSWHSYSFWLCSNCMQSVFFLYWNNNFFDIVCNCKSVKSKSTTMMFVVYVYLTWFQLVHVL